MKNGILRFFFLLFAVASAQPLFAQTNTEGTSIFIMVLVGIAALLILGVVSLVGESLIGIQAKRVGVDKDVNMGIFPSFSELFSPKVPDHVAGKSVKVLNKGFSIDLLGEAEKTIVDGKVNTFALQPNHYRGNAPIPKVEIEVGASVKAGDVVFYDKGNPEIKYVAPVSGEFIALNRGPKRAVHELVFLADKEQSYKKFTAPDLDSTDREGLKRFLMESGAWTLLRQRPFDMVADPKLTPVNIFVSGFDSAPLAADYNLAVAGRGDDLNTGLEVLSKLTDGKVYLGLNGGDEKIASELVNAENCEINYFLGKHPAGNVGVQIHHTDPINAGDVVWTVNFQDLLVLGNLFLEGVWDTTRLVAITGDEVATPHYVRTKFGANIGDLIGKNLVNDQARLISGNVLTGAKKSKEQFLNPNDSQITTVEEGDYYEMFGWLIPQKGRQSLSGTYPTGLFAGTKYKADTNTHGEKRAFVVSGQYESVLPMDIYPQHLMKAIITNDFEKMEGLGIYEVIEEDIALCEYVCTSKQPLQSILRDGLDYVREQA